MERRAVRQVHERDARLGVAPGAHPALDRDRCVARRLAGQDCADVEIIAAHEAQSRAGERPCPAADARREATMTSPKAKPITIADGDIRVSALLDVPARPRACYVLAHGAGAGMTHPFMAAVAAGLLARDIATLRYQFPTWSAARSGRPACPRPRRRAGGGRRRRAGTAGNAADRRRQVVRRPHDLAGAGQGAARRRARPGVPRLPAASGWQAVTRTRQASRRCAGLDALSPGHARRAGEPRRAQAGVRGAW